MIRQVVSASNLVLKNLETLCIRFVRPSAEEVDLN